MERGSRFGSRVPLKGDDEDFKGIVHAINLEGLGLELTVPSLGICGKVVPKKDRVLMFGFEGG